MKKKYYALYEGTNIVLVFDSSEERDEYVREEKIVHPECKRVSIKAISHIIKGKSLRYDPDFGCMIVV